MRYVLLAAAMFMALGCSFGGGGAPAENRIDYETITTFSGDALIIDYAQPDGTRVLLDTSVDAQSTAAYTPDIPGHNEGRSWTLFQEVENGTIMGYVVASWNAGDPGDYLTAGWWIHFKGQRPPDLDIYHDDNFSPVFIDGPELDPNHQGPLPAAGTASYSGGFGGMYTYRYGEAYGEDEGKASIEEVAATVTLTADFAAATLEGCIGCVGDITVRRLHLESAFDRLIDEAIELRAHPKDYESRFAPTAFNPDGTFETAGGVTVSHPERRVGEQRVGWWGGGFSNRRDG